MFDRSEGIGDRFRVGVAHEVGGLRLHDDAGHVVGDEVVEIARDRQAFLLAHPCRPFDRAAVDAAEVEARGEGGGVSDREEDVDDNRGRNESPRTVRAYERDSADRDRDRDRCHRRRHHTQRPEAPGHQEGQAADLG